MGSPYTIELRDRVVGAMRRGMSSYEAAEHFELSQSSAMRWFHRADQMGSPAALPMGGKRPFALAERTATGCSDGLRRSLTSCCAPCWPNCMNAALW